MTGAWSFVTVDGGTGEVCVHGFACKSWRCPQCRWRVARSDFARILEALSTRTARSATWVLLTLTFDPRRYKDCWEAFRAGCRCWQRLRQRLARRYGTRCQPAQIRYIGVWERHRSGWPHVHLAIDSPEIVADIRRRGLCELEKHGFRAFRRDGERVASNWAWKPEVLDELAQACGFGRVSDVQFPRAKEGGVAGYFAKLSAELVGMFDQRPINAPRGFRRLRASRRTLPPRRCSDGRVGGRLVQLERSKVEQLLDSLVLPLPRVRPWSGTTTRVPASTAGATTSSEGSKATRSVAPDGARSPPHP